jgi:hypothetical protein
MALSNVKSSEYKAAGGRAWHKTKSRSSVTMVGPVPAWVTGKRFKSAKKADEYTLTKAAIRETIAAGYDESLVTVVKSGKSGEKAKRKGKGKKMW